MTKLFLLICTLSFTFQGCFINRAAMDVLLKKEFDGKGIAVMNFSKRGSYLPNEIGKIAADKLANALFIEGKFEIIDRSEVNAAQASLQIRNTEFLSADNIKKIGDTLGANYLVLGQIQKISDSEFLNSNEEKELIVSLRIISTSTSSVVGVATYATSYTDNETTVLKKIMYQIVNQMD